MKETGKQFSKFITIGVLNTLLDAAVYILLTRLIHFFGNHLTFAKSISYIAALTFSYYANSTWTFKSEHDSIKLLKFYTTVGSGIFINTGMHYVVIRVLGMHDLAAVIIAAGCTAIWGFSFSKFVVFKHTQ